MKVKIFNYGFSDLPTELEQKINRWLADNPKITIVDRQATPAAGTNVLGKGYLNLTVFIWYTEK